MLDIGRYIINQSNLPSGSYILLTALRKLWISLVNTKDVRESLFIFHSVVSLFPWFCYPGFLILWLCDLGSNIRLISGLFTPTGPSETGPRPKEDISLQRKRFPRPENTKCYRKSVEEVLSVIFYQKPSTGSKSVVRFTR